MEIVAIDADDRADGQGKAGLTWISKTLLNTPQRMNPVSIGNTGGWENCEMRTYLKNTVKPMIPSAVRSAIVPVTKVQSTSDGSAIIVDGQTSTEDVWIPCHKEICGYIKCETLSPYYSKFSNNASRKKKHRGGVGEYWLRSCDSGSTYFCTVSTGGDYNHKANVVNLDYIALGFCTN